MANAVQVEKEDIKRFEDWQSGSFYQFLQVGDKVDEEFKNYFINTLPPACNRTTLIQFGEPYSHADGLAIFATLSKIDGQWTYVGNCFYGESINRE